MSVILDGDHILRKSGRRGNLNLHFDDLGARLLLLHRGRISFDNLIVS